MNPGGTEGSAFAGVTLAVTAYLPDQIPESQLPEIVLSGRSNVGKSSILNRLAGRKSLARVSESPGKTASINFYRAPGFFLVDLPGYGYARTSAAERRKWGDLVETYFAGERRFALLLQLLDARLTPGAQDQQMLDFVRKRRLPCLLVWTKADKLKSRERKERLEALPVESGGFPYLLVSARTGEGLFPLGKRIERALADEVKMQDKKRES